MTNKADDDRGVMAGHGYYDRHSTTQADAAAIGLDLLRRSAGDLDIDRPGTRRIADLGCAQGHNSLAPMKAAIDAIRDRMPCELEVVHTDLPENDWARLFAVIYEDPSSYLAGHAADVHPSVVGRSFYDRLFASASVSIAWTSSSLHWLSDPPGGVGDHFFVQSSTDARARDRYRARSAADWRAFLSCRSVELEPGGSVVFVDVLMGEDGRMGSEPLFDTLEESLRAAREAGRLTADEYAAIVYPTWFRDLAELRAPFAPRFDGPDGARLELITIQPGSLADPFLPGYLASGDAESYGASQADFLRGFLEPSFRSALPDRSEEGRTAILDAVFTDTAHRIAADPRAVSPTYRLVAGRIRRAK